MAVRGRLNRDQIIAALLERDGDRCQYPGCDETLDFLATGPREVTIDHWIPQHFGKANGWTDDEIWDLDNLKLFEKKCNAKKGDLLPNPDGTLPVKESRFRYRRDKRAQRPELCTSCENGRKLGPDEVCSACNSGPQPERFPRWAKMRADECDHEAFWCWACSIGLVSRVGATEMIILGGEGGDS